jgi:hypothetical protein
VLTISRRPQRMVPIEVISRCFVVHNRSHMRVLCCLWPLQDDIKRLLEFILGRQIQLIGLIGVHKTFN